MFNRGSVTNASFPEFIERQIQSARLTIKQGDGDERLVLFVRGDRVQTIIAYNSMNQNAEREFSSLVEKLKHTCIGDTQEHPEDIVIHQACLQLNTTWAHTQDILVWLKRRVTNGDKVNLLVIDAQSEEGNFWTDICPSRD